MKKIFCIPGAGASAVMFLPWVRDIKDNKDLKLCMLEIPGRGMRKNDEPLNDIDELADVFVKKIQTQLEEDETYSIYGYCFGAIIAYEVCRRIEKKDMQKPEYLFFSSIGSPENKKIAEPVFSNYCFRNEITNMFSHYFPPQLFSNQKSLNYVTEVYTRKTYEKYDRFKKIMRTDLEELKFDENMVLESEKELEKIINFANATMEVFSYDQEMLNNYADAVKNPYVLDIPLIVIRGENDTFTDEDDINEWQDYCDNKFESRTIHGNHFSFEEGKDEILDIMTTTLMDNSETQIIEI